MRSSSLLAAFLLPTFLTLAASSAVAQSPTFGLGRTPTGEEVRAWDISIHPVTGAELPPGRGTATEGALLYRRHCARCHGGDGTEGRAPRLVKQDRPADTHPWNLGRILPIRSPYAPTVWDYINRGMPLNREGTLTPDEVYALTALMLYWNGIIAEDEVMDERSLPLVEMPNRDAWAPLPDWKPGTPRWPGYPY
jgi:mono/diheme cytochrome c family protein